MLRFLCLLCLLPALAAAQSQGSRTCRIIFLGAPDGAPEKLHLFDGKGSQEVELPRMNLSPVYNLPGGPLVVRMLPSAVVKPAEVSPEAPSATIPEAVNDLFLLVTPDSANKIAPVKLQVIDVNSANFQKGEMLWFNLTGNSVGGQLGTEQLAMAPNSKTIVKSPASKNEDYVVNLSYRMPGNEALYPLCQTKWQHDTRSRMLFFVVGQNGSRTPRVLGFPDYRAAPEKAANP